MLVRGRCGCGPAHDDGCYGTSRRATRQACRVRASCEPCAALWRSSRWRPADAGRLRHGGRGARLHPVAGRVPMRLRTVHRRVRQQRVPAGAGRRSACCRVRHVGPGHPRSGGRQADPSPLGPPPPRGVGEPGRARHDLPAVPGAFLRHREGADRLELPPGYGHYWSNEPPLVAPSFLPHWGLVAELDGGHPGETVDAYVQLDLGFVEAPAPGSMTNVEPVWLDIRKRLSDPVFDVPPGPSVPGSGSGGRTRCRRAASSWPRPATFTTEVSRSRSPMWLPGAGCSLRRPLREAEAALVPDPDDLVRGVPGKSVAAGDALLLTAVYSTAKR